MHKPWGLPLLLTTIIILLTGCQPSTPSENHLTLSAAASLSDAINDVQSQFLKKHPEINVTLNLASSGTLTKQIEQGAPVDVFISASQEKMDRLQKEGQMDSNHVFPLLKNRIALVTTLENVQDFHDLQMHSVRKVAIGIPESVPAGRYAKETLENLGLWNSLQNKLIYAKDVRQVLHYVETGNVDAGIVYLTDANASKKVITAALAEESWHSPIIYPVGIVSDAKNKTAAKTFVSFLQSDTARNIFRKHGFQFAEE